ncbi:DUF5107 domain-containing protein [Bradyrhizobium japonicum]
MHAAAPVPDGVSLSEQTTTWSTVKFAVDAENGFVSGSLDKSVIVERSFKSYVLENRYLRVTLVPEFGGRILSMVYKPTGHEQLYRTEVGVPYGMKAGNFYYDWLMVYGGNLPTFPDAEHGKTWLKPWAFRVVKEGADEVTVVMSFRDDFDYSARPSKFRGATGIEANYYVTLKADRAALDARVVLKNPNDGAVQYEYWTCTTLAPGSEPKNPGQRAAPKSSRRSELTRRLPGRPIWRTATRARVWAGGASKTCATSRTGQRWASPMLHQICRAGISGRHQP